MSEFENKSSQNIIAAQVLIEEALFTPSIHCSYYSCLQLCKHVLKYIIKISDQQIKDELGKPNLKSHELIREGILDNLKGKLNDKEYMNFNSTFNSLKRSREMADYTETDIRRELAMESVEKSKSLTAIIKRQYGT